MLIYSGIHWEVSVLLWQLFVKSLEEAHFLFLLLYKLLSESFLINLKLWIIITLINTRILGLEICLITSIDLVGV